MISFEQVVNWEFHSRGKLVRKLTQSQINKVANIFDTDLGYRVGDMLVGTYSYPTISQLFPGYPKAKLVVYKSCGVIFVQVYHKRIWDEPLEYAPNYDKVVKDFTKFLDNN